MAKYLTVPLNEKGIAENNYGIENEDNMRIIEFPENEYKDINKKGVFSVLMNKYGLIVDIAETEIIPLEHLAETLELTKDLGVKDCKTFTNALKLALDCGTYVEVSC